MKQKSSTQRVKKHYDEMKAQGFKQVRVWVQVDKEDLIKEIAEAIREGKQVVIKALPATVLEAPKRED